MSTQTSLPITEYIPTYRMQAVQALAKFRREWDEIAEDQSLLDISASIGLLLADVADRLELSPQERYVFLGKRLMKDVQDFMQQQVRPVEE